MDLYGSLRRVWSGRFRIMGAAAVLHFGLLVASVTDATLPRVTRPLLKGLFIYSNFSGANNRYAFYAPAVGSPRRIICFGYVPEDDNWVRVEMPQLAGESGLRLSTIQAMLGTEPKTDDFSTADAITASWAAWVFGQCPQFESVMVLDQALDIPPLREYQANPRDCEWLTLRVYSFARRNETEPEPRHAD